MRVLHFLTQRPGWTGSGTTLHALVQAGVAAGLEQRVLCLMPVGESKPQVGGLAGEHILAISCGEGGDLPFPIPGMSDGMPYESTVFGRMDQRQLDLYRETLRAALVQSLLDFEPQVIHAHHAWIGASIVCEVAGDIPVVLHGHGTGLRQMRLVPELGAEVRKTLQGVAGVCVLHSEHARQYEEALQVPSSRVHVVGAGYDSSVFVTPEQAARPKTLLFAGKWSEAKGLGPLLEAFGQLRKAVPDVELSIAGAGSGPEAVRLQEQMEATPGVQILGRLQPPAMARAFGRAQVFVLPSLYEGLPLVLVEAAACGCRLVSTDLPGVRSGLADALKDRLHLIPCPPLDGPDTLPAAARPGFVASLTQAMTVALQAGPAPGVNSATCAPFGWEAVAGRVRSVWARVGPSEV